MAQKVQYHYHLFLALFSFYDNAPHDAPLRAGRLITCKFHRLNTQADAEDRATGAVKSHTARGTSTAIRN